MSRGTQFHHARGHTVVNTYAAKSASVLHKNLFNFMIYISSLISSPTSDVGFLEWVSTIGITVSIIVATCIQLQLQCQLSCDYMTSLHTVGELAVVVYESSCGLSRGLFLWFWKLVRSVSWEANNTVASSQATCSIYLTYIYAKFAQTGILIYKCCVRPLSHTLRWNVELVRL